MKTPPWSYSGLTSFETCPKRYFHIKVAKDVSDAPGEAAIWGSTVHKYLEDRVKDGTPLPPSVAGYEKMVLPIINREGEKLVEQQFSVDANLQPTDWSSDAAWCRGIVDVGVLTGKRAVLLDWKTGKRKLDSDQLMLFAGLAFAHYPQLEVVSTGFIWLKEGKVDQQKFGRDQIPTIWQQFVPRVARLERAYNDNKFPPKPSGLCGRWCPVPKNKCEFSGRLT